MKLNRKWIHEDFVDLSHISDKEFVDTLTIFGQKVETYERLDAEIKNVVVGKVVSIVRHENSDHMWVCQVDVGEDEPVQIVTGAQNVKKGDLVPAALDDSYLPGNIHIKAGKLRGVESNGMLCSIGELSLTDVLSVDLALAEQLNGMVAHLGGANAVAHRGRTAALDVSDTGGTHGMRSNRLQAFCKLVRAHNALCHNDNIRMFAVRSRTVDFGNDFVHIESDFGNDDDFRARSDTAV